MADDPRVLVLAEMCKQTGLLTDIHNLLVDVLDKLDGKSDAAPAPAPPVSLDGPHGDPIVKTKDPRDWTGDTMTGRTFSQCPPAYLDLLASRYDYFAEKETDEKKRRYNTLDAARARGWAARIRAGYQPPAAEAAESEPRW